jgi:hypothetical protein
MDVVTLSVGSPAGYGPLAHDCGESRKDACDIRADAIENASRLGLASVVPAGNDGDVGLQFPTLNTIHTPGTAPSAITVGASTNSHIFFAGGWWRAKPQGFFGDGEAQSAAHNLSATCRNCNDGFLFGPAVERSPARLRCAARSCVFSTKVINVRRGR